MRRDVKHDIPVDDPFMVHATKIFNMVTNYLSRKNVDPCTSVAVLRFVLDFLEEYFGIREVDDREIREYMREINKVELPDGVGC